MWVIGLLAVSTAFGAGPVNFTAQEGLPNFHQVDEHVYRGGQPTAEGFRKLSRLGVKTVIDLREPGTRARREKAQVEALGMHYVLVPLAKVMAPDRDKLQKLLALFESPEQGPVFVHCRKGSDRTGVAIACYRISHDKWENDRARREALKYGMGFFQIAKKRFIMSYQPRPGVASVAVPAVATAEAH